jgi:hypothetical protein
MDNTTNSGIMEPIQGSSPQLPYKSEYCGIHVPDSAYLSAHVDEALGALLIERQHLPDEDTPSLTPEELHDADTPLRELEEQVEPPDEEIPLCNLPCQETQLHERTRHIVVGEHSIQVTPLSELAPSHPATPSHSPGELVGLPGLSSRSYQPEELLVQHTQSYIPSRGFPTRDNIIHDLQQVFVRKESGQKDLKLKITELEQENKKLRDQLQEQQNSAVAVVAEREKVILSFREKIASLQSELNAVSKIHRYHKHPPEVVADCDSESEGDCFVPYSSPPHHDYVGLALIISNRFDDGKYAALDERTCAEDEERLLYTTFHKMGYAVRIETNLSAQEMTECFKDVQGLILEQDHSSVCCIMSHGGCDDKGQDFIYGSDGGKFYLQKEAYEKFGQCHALRGKLKLFVSQACRGYELPVVSDPLQPSPYSGFAFLSSTTPGQVSLRREPPRGALVNQVDDNVSGRMYESPFISVLCESLRRYHHMEDISIILRRVIQKLQTGGEGIGKYGGCWVRSCPELIITHGETVFVCT